MARAKMPLLSIEASGSLGGLEFKSGVYGNVVSRRSLTPNKATPAQLEHRATFARAAHYWQQLSDADRNAWQSLLTSAPDLKAAVIACYLRYPHPPTAPISPDPLTETPFRFDSVFVQFDPVTLHQAWLQPTGSLTLAQFLQTHIAPISYIAAALHPAKMRRSTWIAPPDSGFLIDPTPHAGFLRVRLDTIYYPQGILSGSWTFDISPSVVGYTITWPDVAPP